MPPGPPRQLLDGGENALLPPVMDGRNADAQACGEGSRGIASVRTGVGAGGHLPIGARFADLIMMANPGHCLRREGAAATTGKALRIEGLRNGGVGPARRQGPNGLNDLWGGVYPLGGTQPWDLQGGRRGRIPQELDPRLPLGSLDWGQGDLFDQEA